jgi:hypothetical protein
MCNQKTGFGSREYACHLANVFFEKGAEKLAQVLKKEVPVEERKKISIYAVGMPAVVRTNVSMGGDPRDLPLDTQKKLSDQAESLLGKLIKAGCGTVQERKEIIGLCVSPFILKGDDIFVGEFFLRRVKHSGDAKAIFKPRDDHRY